MGKEYTKCTKSGNYEAAWCSTKTDDNGDTVLGNYGDCSDKCPVEDDASQTIRPHASLSTGLRKEQSVFSPSKLEERSTPNVQRLETTRQLGAPPRQMTTVTLL